MLKARRVHYETLTSVRCREVAPRRWLIIPQCPLCGRTKDSTKEIGCYCIFTLGNLHRGRCSKECDVGEEVEDATYTETKRTSDLECSDRASDLVQDIRGVGPTALISWGVGDKDGRVLPIIRIQDLE